MNLDLHFVHRIQQQAKTRANMTALRYKERGLWRDISWKNFQEQLNQLSRALLAHNIDVQDKIAIFAHNMERWTIADIATLQIRSITVPIYATNTAQQAEFILNHADVKILFVGDQEQYDQALEIAHHCPKLQKIVAMKSTIQLQQDPLSCTWESFIETGSNVQQNELTQRLNQKQLSDLFTIIYTSGTTGEPKGVMLDYANLAHQLETHDLSLNVTDQDISLSFLPFSHIFERAWAAYILRRGAILCYLEDTNQVRSALTEIRPTLMCAVPRFYEKIYAAVLDKVQKAPKLRQLLGGRIKMMPCGGAKLEPAIGLFFHAIGINIKLGYGMTETTATVSCWHDFQFNPNSIGTLMPKAEVKIGENNEILVRGKMVMKGYYKKPEETAQAFTKDGFLKTGDAGEFDEQGNLFITDRIKELMKTSNGKYIAPQYIESKIGKDKFIEQIAIIADAKKYVSALIVPCFDSLEEYAKQLNIKYHDRLELLKNSDILKMFEQRINAVQKELAHFEQVKKFTLLSQAFSIKLGEITPTLKLRRKVILERYRKQIEAMYHSQEA
ncbi:TPA: long-chain fatty acid--CoA ligase [Haemophilus influenzae]